MPKNAVTSSWSSMVRIAKRTVSEVAQTSSASRSRTGDGSDLHLGASSS